MVRHTHDHQRKSEHFSHFASRKGSGVYKFLIRYLYPWAEKTICVSSGVKRDLVQNFGMPEPRAVVINNPVDIASLGEAASQPPSLDPGEPFIVSVGRLMPNKNFEGSSTLIAAPEFRCAC